LYLTHKEQARYWVLDIEGDGLNPNIIWCVVLKNPFTGETVSFPEKTSFAFLSKKEAFNNWFKEHPDTIFVGHNIISYDASQLNRLWGSGIALDRCVDTLVLSYLYNPALFEGHSLAAWGSRLRFPKTDYTEYGKFNQKTLDYCKNDVELTCKLFLALTERMRGYGFSELSCEIEHKSRILIDEQQVHGFWFDRQRASRFRDELRQRQSDLTEQVQRLFPPKSTVVATRTFRANKDGSTPARLGTAISKFHAVNFIREEPDGGRTYECVDLIPFNLGSPKQRVERMLELGWEPDKFTEKGFPKIDEEALLRFASSPTLSDEARQCVTALAQCLVLQGRCSMLDTWFNNLGDDSRIHGRINTCGASTRRMTHSSPNTANIPSGAKALYGHECRSFWGVEPERGLVLVGYDASGLETAGLCHYLNNSTATDILLRPKPDDVHTVNAQRLTEALGWECDREWAAKTGWYAWLYGAYPPKLGEIVKALANGMSAQKAGEIVVDTFFRNVPGLKQLIESIQYEHKSNRGRLETIDGGFVICPNVSAALNYKIQSAGAILMKLAAILLRQRAAEQKLKFWKVGDIHDEGQLEALLDQVYTVMVLNKAKEEVPLLRHPVGDLAVKCIEEAGRILKFNVGVTGDYKVGFNWNETH
jgi:DNA polymerase-1